LEKKLLNVFWQINFDVYDNKTLTEAKRFKKMFRNVKWCDLMDGSKTSFGQRAVIRHIQKSQPGIIKKCPYFGQFELKNLRSYKEWMLFTPNGILVLEFNISVPKQFLFNAKLFYQIIH
jgi:hypothetical protein